MKIFTTKKLPGFIYKNLEEKGFEVEVWVNNDEEISSENLIEKCKGVDILISAGYTPLDGKTLKAMPSVKMICLYSVGYDHVDLETTKALNIKVTNTPEVLSKATADIAFLLLLATSRKAFYLADTVKQGTWGSFNPTAHLGQELNNKTIGIIGLGKIGYHMAKLCQDAYGMNVIYHNRSPKPEYDKELNAEYVSLETLYQKSDVISLHVDLNPSSYHLIDAKAFEQMKSNVIIVNTSRGDVINQDDLVNALEEKQIWGAGLDVTSPEPLPQDHPLLSYPQVCVLPHIGSATMETRAEMSEIIYQNIIAFSENKPLVTPLY